MDPVFKYSSWSYHYFCSFNLKCKFYSKSTIKFLISLNFRRKLDRFTLPIALFSFAKASTWKNSGRTCSMKFMRQMFRTNFYKTTHYLLLHQKQHNLIAFPLDAQALFRHQQKAAEKHEGKWQKFHMTHKTTTTPLDIENKPTSFKDQSI